MKRNANWVHNCKNHPSEQSTIAKVLCLAIEKYHSNALTKLVFEQLVDPFVLGKIDPFAKDGVEQLSFILTFLKNNTLI